MVKIGGQTFSDEILARIEQTIRAEPKISRRQLSLRTCEWLNWRNPAGRLQDEGEESGLVRSGAL